MLSLDLSCFPLGPSGWLHHWWIPASHASAHPVWFLLRFAMQWKGDGVWLQAGLPGFAAHSVEQGGLLPTSSKYPDIISCLDVSRVNWAASETDEMAGDSGRVLAREQLWNLVFLAPSSPSVLKEKLLRRVVPGRHSPWKVTEEPFSTTAFSKECGWLLAPSSSHSQFVTFKTATTECP